MAHPPQGPFGPPPRKNRAPLFATLVFVAALLAGLGVLGFVEPGFFVSADDTSSDTSSGSASGGGSAGDAPFPDGGPDGDAPDGGGTGDGEAFVQGFVTALNDLDSTTANSMYCPDAVGGMVDYVIKKGPELVIDTTESSRYYLKVTLGGTLGGEPLSSGKISVELEGGNAPCVFTFTAG